MVRILSVHAAVLRYRLRRGELSNSLEELKLGSILVGQFAGKPFISSVRGGQEYKTGSVGVFDSGNSKRVSTGLHVPISVFYPPSVRR